MVTGNDSVEHGIQVRKAPVGPEVGPTSAFYRCAPTGMHGPTCTFWASLTPFSRKAQAPVMFVSPKQDKKPQQLPLSKMNGCARVSRSRLSI